MSSVAPVQSPGFLTPLLEATLAATVGDALPHSGRMLRDHLMGTASILSRWRQPDMLVHAGLFHSIYSTPTYRRQAVSYERRPEIRALLGRSTEQLVFLLSQLDFISLSRALEVQENHGPGLLEFTVRGTLDSPGEQRKIMLPRETADDLLIVLLANYLEQTKEEDGSPTVIFSDAQIYLENIARSGWAKTRLLQGLRPNLPLQFELELLDRYHEALAMLPDDPGQAQIKLRACQGALPLVGELLVFDGLCAHLQGKRSEAEDLGSRALECFEVLGFAWDKHFALNAWEEAAQTLIEGVNSEQFSKLLATCAQKRDQAEPVNLPPRYFQYLRKAAALRGSRHTNWYPGLRSLPVWNSADFSIAQALEANFPAILSEAAAVAEEHFHAEAEAIERSGRWEVLMLFEVGRKREENCAQMPKLTAVLEQSEEVRTSAGLIYLSRMKAGTKVAAHRGGNNHRLRLHLGIVIPEGDCKLRVDDRVVGWKTGECLVFDDFFEHEVWNNTDQDRLVLIVDLWHPDLTAEECLCLDLFNRQVSRHAESRVRYWDTNRKQESKEQKERKIAT